ncbi:hypothetical protein [Hymenobacter sp. BT190]|uniref:hypothetical protein n=1 Tax=Hymenobacter sp. BT190 TaxID=2763505 RepID=UPI0016515DD3|nr:hypothetical protein [Hymenobacter sp. BT190]MBC6698088.1 hypothetical protein [Hymenobacter sp. BT190]
MSQATIKGRTYTVAGTWNDLTGKQLVQVVRLLFAPREVLDLRMRLVLVLLQARWKLRLSKHLMGLSEEWAAELLPLADFLLEASQLTKQLLPRLRPSWLGPVLHGPTDRLAKGDLGEWIEAEAAYHDYHKTKDVRHLNMLVAVLYRPKRTHKPDNPADDNGDVREVFNGNTLPARAELVARLPLAVRQAVLLFYDGCRRRIIRAYEETIFASDPENPGKNKGQHPRQAFLGIAAELATTPDRFDAIIRLPRGTVFFDLDRRIKQNQEREAERARNS